ncbi:MAG: cytochrome c-type biogenesis protein CcmE [Myxococcota bacterium]|jgi:cytochrome c-type biogenesis protein CcmE
MSEQQPGPTRGRRTEKPPGKSGISYSLIVGSVIAIGAALVLTTSFGGGQYAVSIEKVVTSPDNFDGKKLRVLGNIKEGSTKDVIIDGQPALRFSIIDGLGNELAIHYPKSRPDPYKEGRECIIEGRIDTDTEDGVTMLNASTLTVKCPSKYQSEDELVGDTPDYYREKYGSPEGGPSS